MVTVKLQIHPRVSQEVGVGVGSWPIPREVGMAGAGFHPRQQTALLGHDGNIWGFQVPKQVVPGLRPLGRKAPPLLPHGKAQVNRVAVPPRGSSQTVLLRVFSLLRSEKPGVGRIQAFISEPS